MPATFEITNVLPANWNQEIADTYEKGKVIDTTGWDYENNFKNLNMYEAYYYVCACCSNPIRVCERNITRSFKAEEWSNFLKAGNSPAPTPGEVLDTYYERKAQNPTGRRGKVKRTLVVTPEIVDEAEKLLSSMGVVQIAKQLNLNPTELSTALKARNVVIKKGKKKVISE